MYILSSCCCLVYICNLPNEFICKFQKFFTFINLCLSQIRHLHLFTALMRKNPPPPNLTTTHKSRKFKLP